MVEWLLREIPRWDVTLVGRADAQRLGQFYTQQAGWMRSELMEVKTSAAGLPVGGAPPAAVVESMVGVLASRESVASEELVATVQVGALASRESAASAELVASVQVGALASRESEASAELVASAQVGALASRESEASVERVVAESAQVGAALSESMASAEPVVESPVSEPPSETVARSETAAAPAVARTVSGSAREPAAASAPVHPVAHPLEATESPSVETRVVEEASAWSRVWKPFLTDSVGWFVGGFLILAGVYWLVADAWHDMTSLVRAGTVFGLAAGWTLAFLAWAKFLLRREATAPAGRMLERLAAAMAPLATVAVGPTHGAPLVFWPLVLGWAGVSGWLAHRATKRVDVRGAVQVGLSSALAAAMMGVAPLLTGLGVHSAWLVALPVALAAWAFSFGPREEEGAGRFLIAAFAWTTTLFAARLEVALVMAGQPLTLTLLAPALAAGVASVRWLARPSEKAADALSVLVVLSQLGLLLASIDVFTPKPAFVVTALIGAVTAWSLARERISANSARWLPVAYTFAYLAYQRIDQVVPQVVRDAYVALKQRLGYSTAPLPASYGSVYAALFVIVVGFVALKWARAQHQATKREGEVLLDTTAVASALSSLLALASLGTDARPAIIATPLLGVMTLVLAWRSGRFGLTLAGTFGALAAAAALSIGLDASISLGAIALALAVAGIPAKGRHRLTLLLGGGLLGLAGIAVGLVAPPSLVATLTVATSAAALLLIARELKAEEVLDLAWSGPLLTVVAGARWLGPEVAPVALAVAALGAGLVTHLGGRWRTARLMAVAGALAATAWSLLDPGQAWPGVTLLLAAATLFAAARLTKDAVATVLEAGGWALALATLFPQFVFPWPSPLVPQALAGVAVLGASVNAVRSGRSWRTAWVASVALTMALCCCVGLDSPSLILAAVVALAATPALVPAVTVPLASTLVAVELGLHLPWQQVPLAFSIGAVVLAALSLLDRLPVAQRLVLNGQRIGWPAVVMSGFFLVPALGSEPSMPWLPVLVAAVTPLVWSLGLRRPGARLVATALVTATAFWGGAGWLFVPPLFALATAFSMRTSSGSRDVVLDRLTLAVTGVCALGASLAGVGLHASPALFIAWALVLAVLPVGALALRLALAAVIIALAPSPLVVGLAVGVLFAVGFALRHAPAIAARVLGARSTAWAQALAAGSALTLSILLFAREPSGAAQALVVASLLGTALLLGVSALVPVALGLAAVRLPLLAGSGVFEFHPWAPWLALASAGAAAVLRRGFALEAVEEAWERVGAPGKGLDLALWLGVVPLVLLGLPMSLVWLAPAALLLVTPRAWESVAAALLVALTLAFNLRPLDAGLGLSVFGAGLAWFGALRESDASRARLHTGWVLAVFGLVFVADLHAWQLPVAWSLAAVTAWALVRRAPSLRWVGWGAVWAASHAVLAWAGVALSTGAPEALILPWFALATMLVALRPSLTPWIRQHAGVGLVLRGVALAELAAGMFLCPGGFEREAIGGLLAVALSVWLAWRDAKEDEPVGVWFGVLAVSFGFVLTRVLAGAQPGLAESVAALVVAGAAGLSVTRTTESWPEVSKALTQVALWWPVVGLVVAPWGAPVPMAALLVAVAVHYTLAAQVRGLKTGASLLAALAFNGAVLTLWFGQGWGEAQYVLVPVGLSGLVLVQLFTGELGEAWSARLRAVSVSLVYAAAAFRPLAIDAPGAFFLCVALCVAGVAAGIALRVRSFVTLGSVFLVTTVVATLVRWGVREPRLGALFLSALGLAIVAFMVVVTTKKTELLERYKRVRGALERWDG